MYNSIRYVLVFKYFFYYTYCDYLLLTHMYIYDVIISSLFYIFIEKILFPSFRVKKLWCNRLFFNKNTLNTNHTTSMALWTLFQYYTYFYK